MRSARFFSNLAGAVLAVAVVASPAGGQPAAKSPTITARRYTGGSAKMVVSGAFQINQDVAINTAASVSDGDWTWLQFGASGSEAPNVTITYGDGEVGVIIGKGKQTATAEGANCSGKVDVTASSIAGHYTCAGVTSYDPATGKMGKVDVDINFTAKS